MSEQDFMDHGKLLAQDPCFDPSFSQLLDCSACTHVELSGRALRRMATLRMFAEDARRAVVAPRDLVFGLARMYEILRSDGPGPIRAFRSLAEAREWLGLADCE